MKDMGRIMLQVYLSISTETYLSVLWESSFDWSFDVGSNLFDLHSSYNKAPSMKILT